MLTSDDAPDHTSVSHNPSNLISATGNAQAMIEEDPATSSVQYCYQDCRVLRKFIDSFLLEWYSASVRGEAKCVLYGIWYHGKQLFKETMLTVLLQKVKVLPMYGQNIMEYIDLMTGLLGKATPDVITKQSETELVSRCLTSDVVNCIFGTLHARNELIANHPNSRIYNTLSNLVEFEGVLP